MQDNQPFYLSYRIVLAAPDIGTRRRITLPALHEERLPGPRLIWAPDAKVLTPVEFEHARALYAGLITFVDKQIGKLLNHMSH